MSAAFDCRLSAEKLRSLAEGSADKELVATLNRLAGEYDTKAAAHDFLSKAYGPQPTSEQAGHTALRVQGWIP